MAARTNKRDPRAARTLRRISFVREVKQSFLIICEGVNTEPDYFNAFRLTSANIKAVGQGLNTVGLVQKALRMKEEERKKGREYDQCWVVFDKDDFPDRDFNRAIGMAEAGGMRVAYSNQAFEYWFLLHYNLVQGPMHRNQYETKLSGLLGFSYNKEAGTGGRVVFSGSGAVNRLRPSRTQKPYCAEWREYRRHKRNLRQRCIFLWKN